MATVQWARRACNLAHRARLCLNEAEVSAHVLCRSSMSSTVTTGWSLMMQPLAQFMVTFDIV